MEFKDYYKILGVAVDADSKAIKTAYRKLAHKYHPDMNPDKGAEAKFKEIAEAYEVLKDPERRAEFDELRKYGKQTRRGFEPPPGWQSSSSQHYQGSAQSAQDFSDFFNSIFGGARKTSPQSAQQAIRGQDVEIEMPVFLEETIEQCSKTVEYEIPYIKDGQLEKLNKHLKVKIPQGVTDGERIRLAGQGAPGQLNGQPGDLYLHIRLVPHPLFDVQGHNLMLTLPITPWEAALGTKVTVPTLQGNINLTVASNSQSGQKLRIKGKGLSAKGVIGDLYAVIKVVMPPSQNKNSEGLWRDLAQQNDFDPRAEWSKKE